MSNILDIYKVYSLERIVALNKQNLAIQYEQCGQIVALQKQLATANATSREILRNQVKELERQEKVRYCKNLIFNINQLCEKLETIDDTAFCYFICSALITPMKVFAKECLDGLEDIGDKEYAVIVMQNIDALASRMDLYKNSYETSVWYQYECLKDRSTSKETANKIAELELSLHKTEEEIMQLQSEISGILPFFVRSSKKERYAHTISVKKERICSVKEEIQSLKDEQQNIYNQLNEAYQEVTVFRPGWEKEIDEMSSLLPQLPATNAPNITNDKLDPLFKEAAIFVVTSKIALVAALQRKLSIGYNRAARLMNQLEMYGIVGQANEANQREVLITDMARLPEIATC